MNNHLLERFKEYINVSHFNAFRVSLASPDKVKALSYGEVKKIETINYRTLKPEKDGLFCARIFGPVKDWECNCGKYKRMKHRGVTCEKCGVEVIQSRVRRERMGHIDLVAPVCHIWYLKGIPSYLSLIMDMSVKELERVVYFDSYLVINQGNSPYPRKTLLSFNDVESYRDAHPEDLMFKAESGAEAIRSILQMMQLNEEIALLKDAYEKTNSVATRHKMVRRLRVLTHMMHSNVRPEWIVMDVLPVLPPDLRPLVPLEGGRFASSDLNELYRRVLNRNIRLRRLIEIEAPYVIIKNEKRMLQESVDALIDNGRRGQPVRGSNKRPLKSLSEMLRGKQGRFRQNLLGKRVDYSGRSVIVVDPELRLDQCGLPKTMALEIYKSYILAGLLERELAPNLRVAKKMVEDGAPEIWDVLEDVVKSRPVLLNRAPTLHRLGIQAFHPVLVDGKAIKIHPLVCSAFNADFDGDTMSVHLPLSDKACKESETLIISTQNILSPANGQPTTVPSQDMILGLHYMSKVRCNVSGEGMTFSSVEQVVTAYQCNSVDMHARIKVRLNTGIVETTVGRVLLYDIMPKGADFSLINKVLRKNDLKKLIQVIYAQFPLKEVLIFLDNIKKYGFYHSTMSGVSFGIEELLVPKGMDVSLKQADKEVNKLEKLYEDGVITNGERKNKVVSTWFRATSDIAQQMMHSFEQQDEIAYKNETKDKKPFNSIYMILASGAKGSRAQIKQLVGMRGLMSKPSGEIIETPVRSNFRDGLSVFEYFISTHGARKGQADTALKTANSGYLTRRLVDVSQDVVVTINDCKTLGFKTIRDLKDAGDIVTPLHDRIYGRTLASDIKDSITSELIASQGTIVDRALAQKISKASIQEIPVRSVLSCQAKRGVCAQCYGFDLAKSRLVDIGTTVGIIAAQSIGEPGTQLTMRTFHIGGTASGSESQSMWTAKHDATVELRDIVTVKNKEGKLVAVSRKGELCLKSDDGRELQHHVIDYGSILHVENGQKVAVGDKLVEWDVNANVIVTEKTGRIEYVDIIKNVTVQEEFDERSTAGTLTVLEHKSEKHHPRLAIVDDKGEEIATYYLPSGSYISVTNGQEIHAGDVIAKIALEVSKTKDITVGGLPRIAELFEARSPKEAAIISDCDGVVSFGGLYRGMRKISVVSNVTTYDYLIPRGKQINVQEGERVKAGDQLTSGDPVLHDMLRILGPDVVQRYIVDRIQEIYRNQGIDINDTHIEVVVKQMMRKVKVTDAGESDFLIGDKVDRVHFKEVNDLLKEQGKKPAKATPILMGITVASLGTESVISAASFQETTRILTEAALLGKTDYLYGLKENLIIGKLIPAGTGIPSYKKKYLGEDMSELEKRAKEAEKYVREQETVKNI